MRWIAAVALLGLAVGCRSNDRADLVEAELRTRDRQVRELQDQLERERALNLSYEQQNRIPRTIEPSPDVVVSPGMPIRDISIARGTAGIDDDGHPGDDGILVVVVPRDEDRTAIKLPGSLSVAVWEVTPDGLKIPFTTWEVPANGLRPLWQSGLFGSGYQVRLKWKTPPTQSKLRVVVQLRALDGRVLEADKDITIRVVPIVVDPGSPVMPPILPPAIEHAPITPPPNTFAPITPPPNTFAPVRVAPSAPFPQPDLGPKGPPAAAIDERSSDGPTLLPSPRPSLRESRSSPVQLMEPVPLREE